MNKAVPELRFPGFKGNWERQKLGNFFEEFRKNSTDPDQFEVLTSARSGLVPQREYYGEGRIVDRDNVGFNIIPPNYVTYRSRSDDRRFFFNENKTGKTGIISVYYPVFRVGNGSNKFFIELLSNKQHYIGKFSVGTSQTVLSLNELKKIRLRVPSESEQQKIADFLDTVSRKITLLTDKKTALEDYKRGLMQRLFSRELRFTRDDGSAFPDWEERKLGKVANIQKGEQINRDSLSDEGSFPVINGGTGPSGYHTEFNRLGDTITISEGGNSCGHVAWQNSPFWCGGHCYIVEPLGDGLSKSYLLQALKFVEVHIMRLRVGSGLPNIQKGDLLRVELPIPHPDEQRKIAAALSALDAKIDALSQKISEMEAFKKGLLQKLFV